MIEVDITEEMLTDAKTTVKQLGAHKNNYRSSPDSMITGYLGEVVFSTVIDAENKNTYDYDFVKDGKTIDVKTKRVKGKPQDYWQVSVFSYNTKQKCDYYAFVQVNTEYTKGWVIGCVPKTDFLAKAYLVKKGVKQPNGLIPKQDSYNLTVGDIEEMTELL